MRRFALAIVVFVIATMVYLILGRESQHLESDAIESPATLDTHTIESQEDSNSDSENQGSIANPQDIEDVLIRQVTLTEGERLQPWLDDVFLPKERFALRHNLVAIERKALEESIYRSLNQGTTADLDGENSSPNTMTLHLFEDSKYDVAINRVSEGRYGHLHANGVVVSTDPVNSSVEITINPDSTISLTLVTPGAHFAIRAGQENPYHVVVQIDTAKASASIFVN